MTVKLMMGFDLIPGAFAGSQFYPTPAGNGLQPFTLSHNITFTGSGTATDSVGVTGRVEDSMADGRPGIVCYRSTANYRPTFSLGLAATDRPMRSDLAYRYTVGFRWRAGEGSTATPLNGDALLSGMGLSNQITVTTTWLVALYGTSTTARLVKGQEYYFEFTMEHNGVSSGSTYIPTLTLRIDGELIMTREGPTMATNTTVQFAPMLGIFRASLSATANVQRWLFNDIYITDNQGDAPFNGPLGPQRVRLIHPDEVVANTWNLSEGTNPLALIGQANGRDDTKFLTAPDDASLSSYHFGIPTNAKSIVNGIQLYARAKREDGASRPLQGVFAKDDGTVIAETAPVSLSTVFSDVMVGGYTPTNAAEAANLRDSVLQNMVISLKAPTP
ncbi:hypothetical protein [Xanthomonas phage RTH11]|nr:hypothetical protein [Xanthomonas phage RTH11]